ncbi:MAG: hypothetical protein DRH57_06850 [Candidatus Cloacimonadota bacterium]|nr:MAG: hypothetical protein DRH57_06850 [Candidatus Cloacimonadota bacterium]
MTKNKQASLQMQKHEIFSRSVIFLTDGERPLALFPIYMDMSLLELKQLKLHNDLDDKITTQDFRKIMFLDEDGNFEYQWLMNKYVAGLDLAEEDDYQEVLQSLLDQNAISMNSVLNIGLEDYDDL